MLALGFAENREDVQRLIAAIDKNGNGEVELDEFLAIIKSGKVKGSCNQDRKELVVLRLEPSSRR